MSQFTDQYALLTKAVDDEMAAQDIHRLDIRATAKSSGQTVEEKFYADRALLTTLFAAQISAKFGGVQTHVALRSRRIDGIQELTGEGDATILGVHFTFSYDAARRAVLTGRIHTASDLKRQLDRRGDHRLEVLLGQ